MTNRTTSLPLELNLDANVINNDSTNDMTTMDNYTTVQEQPDYSVEDKCEENEFGDMNVEKNLKRPALANATAMEKKLKTFRS